MSVTRSGSSAHYTDIQNNAWARVVDAVHAADGIIFQQLYHVGRKAIAAAMPGGVAPIAPSPIPAVGGVLTDQGLQPFTVPREIELAEIPGLIDEFRCPLVVHTMRGSMALKSRAGTGF